MFDEAERQELMELAAILFDSFREQVVLFKTPTAVFVSSSANYNFAFEKQPALIASTITNSGIFWATIEYETARSISQTMTNQHQNSNFSQPLGEVRLAVSGSLALDFITKSEKIIIDGKDYRRSSDIVFRGILNRDYFDCWLTKIDNA